jgi:tRNA1Val (adenine37-N6)-methyltransferase
MLTGDALLGGRLRLRQPADGYRFSVDAVLLAGFCRSAGARSALDLGAGCGVVGLLLAHRNPALRLCGVELQPELAELAAANVRDNGLQARVAMIAGRLQDFGGTAEFPLPVDLVVSNPPYRAAHSGRVNPHPQRAAARHEIHVDLAALAEGAARMLRRGGRFAMIYPAERLGSLLAAMQRWGLEPKRLRLVHSRPGERARRVLAEGIKGARSGLTVEAPLYVYAGPGAGYSTELAALLAG